MSRPCSMPADLAAVIERDWCSGCGVCAAVCPTGALLMVSAKDDAPRPELSGECTLCGRCEAVCPWGPSTRDEDTIAADLYGGLAFSDAAIGRYIGCYVGHAAATRERAASGGLLTWLLGRLLDERTVDGVALVAPGGEGELFSYRIVTRTGELAATSGSHYYPCAVDAVLADAVSRGMRIAVVGLPCVIKAVRRAAEVSPAIRTALGPCLSLTCGQQKRRAFTSFAAQRAGVPADATLRGVRYRVKREMPPASTFDIEFTYHTPAGETVVREPFPIREWVARLFALPSCDLCDDLVGETADASFMDAWLPRFTGDPAGTSIVVTRSADIDRLFRDATERGEIDVQPTEASSVSESQATALAYKRQGLADRLERLVRRGRPVPRKRVAPSRSSRRLGSLADRCAAAASRKSMEVWRRRSEAAVVMRATAPMRLAERLLRSIEARVGGRGRSR